MSDKKNAMGNKIKAMIIDGSYTNRVLFRAILEEFDFEVTEVCNPVKALQLLEHVEPNIILLDLSMPLKSGFDFLDEIARMENSIPVIAVSVYDDQQIIKDALDRGVKEYLVKPIELHELATKLAQFVECEI